MVENLRKEERKIVSVLSRYGCLERAQLVRYLPSRNEQTIERALDSLLSRKLIYETGLNCYALDAVTPPDQNMILAFWIFLKLPRETFRIKANDHYPAPYPAQMFFLHENATQYQIAVIEPGQEYHIGQILASLPTPLNAEEGDKVNLIVGIRDKSQTQACLHYLGDYAAHAILALAETRGFGEEPGIRMARCPQPRAR